MKKAFLLIVILSSSIINAQNWQWAHKLSTASSDVGTALASDAFGNIYLSARNGYTVGDILSKHDSNGNLLWARNCSGSVFVSLTTDKVGDIYACGYFGANANFKGGNNNDTNITSNGYGWDAFLVKYNTNGDLQWVRTITSLTDFQDEAKCVRVDQFSNAYVTGSSHKMVNSIYKRNFYLRKYDASGNLLWIEDSGWKGNMNSTSIVLAYNDCYVTGNFTDSAYFANSVLTANGGAIFLVKFASSGQLKWAIKDGSGSILPKSMVEHNGKFTLAGVYSHSTTLGQQIISGTYQNLFIAQYDSSANFQWVSSASNANAESLASDQNGNFFITGVFKKTGATFGGTTITSQKLQDDIFVTKCDSSGNFKWAIAPTGDTFGSNWSSAVTVSNNHIIITGRFAGTTNFGSTSLNAMNGNSYDDLFLAAIDDSTIITSLGDAGRDMGAKIWPNPASENLYLQFANAPFGNTIQITNLLGETISLQITKDKYLNTLNVSTLNPGLYFITSEGIKLKFIKK